MKKLIAALIVAATALIATACTDAEVVDHNMTKDAENFKVLRRIVFVNGITDKYLLSIEGYCNINDQGGQLEVICKTGKDEYKKHFLGKSNNVTYVIEQLEGHNVSDDHYKVVFKPETIIPDVEVR